MNHNSRLVPFSIFPLLVRMSLRSLFRNPRKTTLVGSLILLGSATVLIANATFDSAERGLKTSFVRSLTGDFVVSADSEENFGLFGNEIPIVDEYQAIPVLPNHSKVMDILSNVPGVQTSASIVSAFSILRLGKYTAKVTLFGIDPESYFQVCSDIQIIRGDPSEIKNNGVFLNESIASAIEKSLKHKLVIGDKITFSSYASGSFRLRKGVFAGILHYPAPNDALDSVILADPILVRGLCDYTLGFAKAAQDAPLTNSEDYQDLDSLFSDSKDVLTADTSEQLTLEAVESELSQTGERGKLILTDDAAWSFILVKTDASSDPIRIRAAAHAALSHGNTEARTLDWPKAVGSMVLAHFAVRTFFQVGLIFLAFGAVMVMMNALTISVLERTDEIGTMRALGATKGFIRLLFMMETFLLFFSTAVVGTILGSSLCALITTLGIRIGNPLLISLFGGSTLSPNATIALILTQITGSTIVGCIALVYPLSLALGIEPRTAMAER